MTFDNAGMVSVFETTIRVLGGLLSAFELSREKVSEKITAVSGGHASRTAPFRYPPDKGHVSCTEKLNYLLPSILSSFLPLSASLAHFDSCNKALC